MALVSCHTSIGCFSPRPKRAPERRQCGVAALDHGMAIALRLALTPLGGSEDAIRRVTGHQEVPSKEAMGMETLLVQTT